MKKQVSEIKSHYMRLGRFTRRFIGISASAVISLLIISTAVFLFKNQPGAYNDCMLISGELLKTARSVFGMGVLGTIMLASTEKRTAQ